MRDTSGSITRRVKRWFGRLLWLHCPDCGKPYVETPCYPYLTTVTCDCDD